MIERINLVPQKPLAERVKMALPVVLGSLLALILLVSFIQYRWVASRISRAEAELAAMTSQKNLTDQLQGRTQALRSQIAAQRQQLGALQSTVAGYALESPRSRSYATALARITDYLPDSIRCTKISFNGSEGQLSGEAVHYNDLPALVTHLKNDPLFKEAVIKAVDKSSGSDWHQFVFTIQIGLK